MLRKPTSGIIALAWAGTVAAPHVHAVTFTNGGPSSLHFHKLGGDGPCFFDPAEGPGAKGPLEGTENPDWMEIIEAGEAEEQRETIGSLETRRFTLVGDGARNAIYIVRNAHREVLGTLHVFRNPDPTHPFGVTRLRWETNLNPGVAFPAKVLAADDKHVALACVIPANLPAEPAGSVHEETKAPLEGKDSVLVEARLRPPSRLPRPSRVLFPESMPQQPHGPGAAGPGTANLVLETKDGIGATPQTEGDGLQNSLD